MTLKAETSTHIQTVIQADPALQVQLKCCTDADSAAILIVKAASSQGVELSKADVLACFMASPSSQTAAISDDELDLVAGGEYDPPTETIDELFARQRRERNMWMNWRYRLNLPLDS